MGVGLARDNVSFFVLAETLGRSGENQDGTSPAKRYPKWPD
jgi:hypothetical protein